MEIRTCEEYVLAELHKKELELCEATKQLANWKNDYLELLKERDFLYNENLWYRNTYGERDEEPKRGC